MKITQFGFLTDYFEYRLYKAKEPPVIDLVKIQYGEHFVPHAYAVCLVDKKSETILELTALTSEPEEPAHFELFDFYVNKLPDLNLHMVAYMLALVSSPGKPLDEPFKLAADYPSEFAAEYLKDTHGNIVYTYQFMELLSFCLPHENNSHNQMNKYRSLFNQKQDEFLREMEAWYLPDGYSLYDLMKQFTPLRRENDEWGFLIQPNHKTAFRFIKTMNKYM